MLKGQVKKSKPIKVNTKGLREKTPDKIVPCKLGKAES